MANTPGEKKFQDERSSVLEPIANSRVKITGPVVIALGGNAIGSNESPGAVNDMRAAGETIADAAQSGLVITHGNGPQIGYLQQIQAAGYQQELDVLGAETEGWLGYRIEQTINNYLPPDRESISVMTRMEVRRNDPALTKPEKPIGGWLDAEEAARLESEHGWEFIQRGQQFRRVVPSPAPIACPQINSIRALLDFGSIVVCAGGGGIPVTRNERGELVGLEAVIDKDLASALIAEQLGANLLVLATNVDGVYENWSWDETDQGLQCSAAAGPLGRVAPERLLELELDAGSMGAKVHAACTFASQTGKPAVIGHLNKLEQLLRQSAGTVVDSRLSTAAR